MRLCRVEAETVVMRAPASADMPFRLDQYVRDIALRQACRRRQTGRSGADDQHITAFHEVLGGLPPILEAEDDSSRRSAVIKFRVGDLDPEDVEVRERVKV